MAISASGAVSFSQIQTEYGGSNPISLSEYYANNPNAAHGPNSNTGSPVSVSTQTGTTNTTVTTTTTTKYGTTTNTIKYYAFGFLHSSLANNQYPQVGDQSITVPRRTGGNISTIPVSGAISSNNFRGTNTPTDNSFVCYGWQGRVPATTTNGYSYNWQYAHYVLYISGHWGSNAYEYTNWSGVPFTYFRIPNLRQIGYNGPGYNWVQTDYHGSAAFSANGMFAGAGNKLEKQHGSNSTIGNYTFFKWGNSGSSPGTVTSGSYNPFNINFYF
jgi:hypothetical protein